MNTIVLDAIASPHDAVERAGQLLRDGQLVAIPTETVYGCAAIISNDDAVRSIFRAKGRPQDNPLIVHVAERNDVDALAHVGTVARQLIEAFFPGPLTLVLPKRDQVSRIVTANLDTVAVRMPEPAVTRAVIAAAGSPLAAPSANRSGRPSPTTAAHVMEDLGGRIAAIVDAGPCTLGLESTVVRITDDRILLLRPGACTRDAIAAVANMPVVMVGVDDDARRSPGTRYRHYAPNAAVVLVSTVEDVYRELASHDAERCLVLAGIATRGNASWRTVEATNVYAELRRADTLHVEKIIVLCDEQVRADEALMNRLRKAAEPRQEDR